MSRVDNEDERLAERLHEQRLREEAREKSKKVTDSAFADKLRSGEEERHNLEVRQKDLHGRAADERRRDPRGKDVLRFARAFAQGEQAKSSAQQRAAANLSRSLDAGRHADQDQGLARQQGHHSAQEQLGARAKDEGSDALRSERRKNAMQHTERQSERVEASSQTAKPGGGAPTDGGAEHAGEREAGGQGGKGQQREGNNGGGLPGQFRLNPALMPPAPVIQARDTGRSERLRALANEIAQKIVEKARVGRNAAGHPEFQIELRSNVLKGLNIRVSAKQGRISAVFSGGSREVREELEKHLQGLREALTQRKLIVEELRIEGQA